MSSTKKTSSQLRTLDKEQLEKIFASTDKIMQLNPAERREIC